MARKLSLPSWAEVVTPGKIKVFPDQYIAEYFSEFDDHNFSLDDDATPAQQAAVEAGFQVNQCWLAVATLFMRLDLERAVANTGADAPVGGALTVLIQNEESGRLASYKVGPGEEVGRSMAYKLYKSVRGG